MGSAYIRIIIYEISTFLALISASWAGYGVVYADGALPIDLVQAVWSLVGSVAAGFGLGGVIFALWGSGGFEAARRLVIYLLAPWPVLIAAMSAGWGVSLEGAVL